MQSTCSIDGCERQAKAKNFCELHYRRWRKHGNPLIDHAGQQGCSVDGCPNKHKCHGWCDMHYQRWRKYGDPLITHRAPNGAGCIHDGYQYFYNPQLGRAEKLSRTIMAKKLGRRLLSSEEVHHKDHNRLNDDPSNLEVIDKRAHGILHGKEARIKRMQRTACRNGHSYTPENTYQNKGIRRCRTCWRISHSKQTHKDSIDTVAGS